MGRADYEMAQQIPALRIIQNYKPKYVNGVSEPEPTKPYLIRCAKLTVLWYLCSSIVVACESLITDYDTQ